MEDRLQNSRLKDYREKKGSNARSATTALYSVERFPREGIVGDWVEVASRWHGYIIAEFSTVKDVWFSF